MKRFSLLFVMFCLFLGFVGVLPADARSICRGKAQITLKDGTRACVLRKEITTLTRTRTGVPGWGSESQVQKTDGGLVIVNFRDEASFREVEAQAQDFRRDEICRKFRDEFRAKIARPRDPFMVVIMTWGERPSPDESAKGSWLESFHGRLCNRLRAR